MGKFINELKAIKNDGYGEIDRMKIFLAFAHDVSLDIVNLKEETPGDIRDIFKKAIKDIFEFIKEEEPLGFIKFLPKVFGVESEDGVIVSAVRELSEEVVDKVNKGIAEKPEYADAFKRYNEKLAKCEDSMDRCVDLMKSLAENMEPIVDNDVFIAFDLSEADGIDKINEEFLSAKIEKAMADKEIGKIEAQVLEKVILEI